MNSDPENFDALRGLLKLKRYEQPPPGYFNGFSGQVIARIKAGERGEASSILGRLFDEDSWWRQLGAALQGRPGLAGAFGAAVCALLISGIVYSENSPAPVAQALMPGGSTATFPTAALAVNETFDQPDLGYGSTNPMAPVVGSIFDQFPFPQAQPASLTLPAN
jgi:hypothetical protein